MLNEGVRPSQVELGSHHQLTRNLVHRLERLGYTVTLEQKAACPLTIHPLNRHAAPEQTRLDMVYWLRAKYPITNILALNPADYHRLNELNYNARYRSPDA